MRRKKKRPASSRDRVYPKPKPKKKKRRTTLKKRSPRFSPKPKQKKRRSRRKLTERAVRLMEKRVQAYREEQRKKKIKPLTKSAVLVSDRRVRAVEKVLREEGFDVARKRKRGGRAIDTMLTVRGVPKDPSKGRERMSEVFERLSKALLANKRGLKGLRLGVQVNPADEIWQVYEFERTPMTTALRVLGRKGKEKSAIGLLRLAVTNLFHKMEEYGWDASEWRFVFREERRK